MKSRFTRLKHFYPYWKLHHLKNAYAHKKSDLSEKSKSNSYLNSYEFSGDSFAQLKKKAKTTREHKTMPEITQKSYKGKMLKKFWSDEIFPF